MEKPDVIGVSRQFKVMWANMIDCPWSRAMELYNLGVKGGTTRKRVDWYLDNGVFA
jgi:hypothetical protein